MAAIKPKTVTLRSYFCKHCKQYFCPRDQEKDLAKMRCGNCKTPNWDQPKRDRVGRPAMPKKKKPAAKPKPARPVKQKPPEPAPLDMKWLDSHA